MATQRLRVFEVTERDPDGNPSACVERHYIEWPFAEFPQPLEHFIVEGQLYGCERRIWQPDCLEVVLYVFRPGQVAEGGHNLWSHCKHCGVVFDEPQKLPYCADCDALELRR